jgi:hypothetical protein
MMFGLLNQMLPQYWLPARMAEAITPCRRTRVNVDRLSCDEVARRGDVSVGEFVAASSFAANGWWWLAVCSFGLGSGLAALFSMSVSSSSPAWMAPFAVYGVGAAGLAQYPFLVYRAARARRAGTGEQAVPARLMPKRRDFWIACVVGMAVPIIVVVGTA